MGPREAAEHHGRKGARTVQSAGLPLTPGRAILIKRRAWFVGAWACLAVLVALALSALLAVAVMVVVRAPDLPAGAFAVAAPRPAARPTLALLELLLGSANAAFSGHLLLGILDPADELVAGQRRNVVPGIERGRIGDQSFAQVFRKFVHHPAGHSLATHKTTVAAILDARK